VCKMVDYSVYFSFSPIYSPYLSIILLCTKRLTSKDCWIPLSLEDWWVEGLTAWLFSPVPSGSQFGNDYICPNKARVPIPFLSHTFHQF
jgi:hypothetical protein